MEEVESEAMACGGAEDHSVGREGTLQSPASGTRANSQHYALLDKEV